jgi:hypothetical protein
MPALTKASAARIREAARAAQKERSVRKVAAEMKISPAGLRYFLGGGEPYEHTSAKLHKWYVRYGRKASEAEALESGVLGLGALLELLPPAVRPVACANVLRGLRRACQEFGQVLPEGLEEAIESSANAIPGAS